MVSAKKVVSSTILASTMISVAGLAATPAAGGAVAARPATAAVTILAPGSAGVQSLSSAYTLSFPHWVLDGAPSGGPSKIPTAGDEGGWVQPFSLDELWMASDLPEPRSRLALGALVKDGQLRCVFPALDAPVVTSTGKAWRNRGLSSVPVAKVWLDFTTIPLEQLSVSAFSRKVRQGSTLRIAAHRRRRRRSRCLHTPSYPHDLQEGADWVPMGSERIGIQGAVNRVVEFIADPPPGLDRGFALVTAPLEDGDLPAGRLSDGGDKIRVFLTDYPDPGKLLGNKEEAGRLDPPSQPLPLRLAILPPVRPIA